MINKENYIVIQGWMITDLGLKGNELLIYALIYGFSQDNTSKFQGSANYIAEWTNTSRQSVINNLKSLVEKGLIKRNDIIRNGVRFVDYYVTNFTGCQKSLQGMSKNFTGGCQKSLQHNIEDNIIDNLENNILKEKECHIFGEFNNIKLSDEHISKLKELYGNKFDEAIETLSSYIQSSGKKYKDFYAVLNKHNWVYKKVMYNNTQKTKFEWSV